VRTSSYAWLHEYKTRESHKWRLIFQAVRPNPVAPLINTHPPFPEPVEGIQSLQHAVLSSALPAHVQTQAFPVQPEWCIAPAYLQNFPVPEFSSIQPVEGMQSLQQAVLSSALPAHVQTQAFPVQPEWIAPYLQNYPVPEFSFIQNSELVSQELPQLGDLICVCGASKLESCTSDSDGTGRFCNCGSGGTAPNLSAPFAALPASPLRSTQPAALACSLSTPSMLSPFVVEPEQARQWTVKLGRSELLGVPHTQRTHTHTQTHTYRSLSVSLTCRGLETRLPRPSLVLRVQQQAVS